MNKRIMLQDIKFVIKVSPLIFVITFLFHYALHQVTVARLSIFSLYRKMYETHEALIYDCYKD